MRHQQATLKQIAEKIGLSVPTVSRILSEKDINSFSSETINLVRAAAKELHYRPNRLIRGMQTGQSGLIGVMMPSNGSYYGMVYEGVHDHLVAHDRTPISIWTVHDSRHAVGKNELEQIHRLVDLRVEGIILKPIFDAASDLYLQEIFNRNIPLVVVDRELPQVRTSFIGTDDAAGIRTCMRHLVELGHRSIVYFGPDTTVSTEINRHKAFNSCLANFPEVKGYAHLTKFVKSPVEEVSTILKNASEPTAIMAMNDDFARMVYEAAARENIRIPEDLSVTGFGDLAFASFLNPPLTTLDQHPYDVGVTAANLLLAHCDSTTPVNRCQKILISPDLVIRKSTEAPRQRLHP